MNHDRSLSPTRLIELVRSFITLMYVAGTLAQELKYVTEVDLYPGCDTGGPG